MATLIIYYKSRVRIVCLLLHNTNDWLTMLTQGGLAKNIEEYADGILELFTNIYN